MHRGRPTISTHCQKFRTSIHNSGQEYNITIILSPYSLAKIYRNIKITKKLINDTWNLLKLKHPEGPVPTPPTALDDPAVLPADFNLLQALRSFPKCTAAGPSGMRIQHLIDVSSAPLPTPFLSTLKQLVNHLAAGKAPKEVPAFLQVRPW